MRKKENLLLATLRSASQEILSTVREILTVSTVKSAIMPAFLGTVAVVCLRMPWQGAAIIGGIYVWGHINGRAMRTRDTEHMLSSFLPRLERLSSASKEKASGEKDHISEARAMLQKTRDGSRSVGLLPREEEQAAIRRLPQWLGGKAPNTPKEPGPS